jgi:hypothetical protein
MVASMAVCTHLSRNEAFAACLCHTVHTRLAKRVWVGVKCKSLPSRVELVRAVGRLGARPSFFLRTPNGAASRAAAQPGLASQRGALFFGAAACDRLRKRWRPCRLARPATGSLQLSHCDRHPQRQHVPNAMLKQPHVRRSWTPIFGSISLPEFTLPFSPPEHQAPQTQTGLQTSQSKELLCIPLGLLNCSLCKYRCYLHPGCVSEFFGIRSLGNLVMLTLE